MIIFDLNQIVYKRCIKAPQSCRIRQKIGRTAVIQTLVELSQQFGDRYGEMVIATDGDISWRHAVFPHYKHKRRQREDATRRILIDFVRKLKDELWNYAPWRTIVVKYAEADDIIATLALSRPEPMLIVSGEDRKSVV